MDTQKVPNFIVLRTDDTKENNELISSIALDFGLDAQLQLDRVNYRVAIIPTGIAFVVSKKVLVAQLNWALYQRRNKLH